MRTCICAVLLLVGCVGEVIERQNPPPPSTQPPPDMPPPPSCTLSLGAQGALARVLSANEQSTFEVRLADSCDSISGVAVSFALEGPAAGSQLLATSALTDASGLASTHLKAGAAAATFTVVAKARGLEARFTVTVTSAPAVDGATLVSSTLPATLNCTARVVAKVTMRNSGTTTWTSDDCSLSGIALPGGAVAPGATATFDVPVQAPATAGTVLERLQMQRGGTVFGDVVARDVMVSCGCSFPQGVPEADFIAAATAYSDTDPMVDAAVNAAMQSLTTCSPLSSCSLSAFAGATTDEKCQSWFAAVTQKLRDQGLCAGQHELGSTDEIAVSNTGCPGHWYGYHICNFGGPLVVWNPGARRGWWQIAPSHCPP